MIQNDHYPVPQYTNTLHNTKRLDDNNLDDKNIKCNFENFQKPGGGVLEKGDKNFKIGVLGR